MDFQSLDMVTRNDTALDLFRPLPDRRILVRRVCRAGVVPQHLVTHIRAHYRRLYLDFQTNRATIRWVKNRLLIPLPREFLRNHDSVKYIAFPPITQNAACCTPGMRRIPQMCTLEVVAADMKRAAFQQPQGYITTRLKRFSGCDRMFFSRESNDNTTVSAPSLEQHQQAVSSSSACLPDGRAFLFHSSCS
jgi:hypothetical protein